MIQNSPQDVILDINRSTYHAQIKEITRTVAEAVSETPVMYLADYTYLIEGGLLRNGVCHEPDGPSREETKKALTGLVEEVVAMKLDLKTKVGMERNYIIGPKASQIASDDFNFYAPILADILFARKFAEDAKNYCARQYSERIMNVQSQEFKRHITDAISHDNSLCNLLPQEATATQSQTRDLFVKRVIEQFRREDLWENGTYLKSLIPINPDFAAFSQIAIIESSIKHVKG